MAGPLFGTGMITGVSRMIISPGGQIYVGIYSGIDFGCVDEHSGRF